MLKREHVIKRGPVVGGRGSGGMLPGKFWILITPRYREMDLKLTNKVFRYKRLSLKTQCFHSARVLNI